MKPFKKINIKKELAKTLYTRLGENVAEIAAAAQVPPATALKWIKDEKWQELKKNLLPSSQTNLALLNDLLEQLAGKMKTSDEINPKDVDMFVKYSTAIKNLESGISISDIVATGKQFISWLHEQDAEIAKEVLLRFDAFINYKLKNG